MRQYTALVLSMLTCCATGAMAGSAIGFFWFATHPASLITKILVYVAASIFLFIVVDDFCERAFKKQFWLASVGCLAVISVGVIVGISAFATTVPEESPSWPCPQMRPRSWQTITDLQEPPAAPLILNSFRASSTGASSWFHPASRSRLRKSRTAVHDHPHGLR